MMDKRIGHTKGQFTWFYTQIVFFVLIPFAYLVFIIWYLNWLGVAVNFPIALLIAITFLSLAWLSIYFMYRIITIFYYGKRLYDTTCYYFRVLSILILVVVFIVPTIFILSIIYFLV